MSDSPPRPPAIEPGPPAEPSSAPSETPSLSASGAAQEPDSLTANDEPECGPDDHGPAPDLGGKSIGDTTDKPGAEDYEVGYGKPPKQHQFKKGDGRVRPGRPKRSLNLKTDLLAELGEIVPLRLNGTQRNISKQRAVLKVLMTKAIQGDMRATQALLSLMNRVLGPPTEEDTKTEPSAQDVEIVTDLLEKMSNSGGGQ